jgi:hypothetical protein
MRKFLKIVLVAFALFAVTTTVNADEKKGQKIIIKKLKNDCGFAGNVLAHKHTQDQWEKIYKAGDLNKEIKIICPKSQPLKESYLPHVYDFLYNYAVDSGNVPSC